MNEQYIFLLQLLAASAVGGFVGEYRRFVFNKDMLPEQFLANVFSGMFMSILLAYFIYDRFLNKVAALIVCAWLSHQEHDFLTNTISNLLNHWFPGARGGRT